jgi:hypothetical protein
MEVIAGALLFCVSGITPGSARLRPCDRLRDRIELVGFASPGLRRDEGIETFAGDQAVHCDAGEACRCELAM